MKTLTNKFEVVVSIKSFTNFDSNRQKRTYKAEYELYKKLGFESAMYNTLKIKYIAKDSVEAREIYEAKRSELKNVRIYKGLHINQPDVSIFKNDKVTCFEIK